MLRRAVDLAVRLMVGWAVVASRVGEAAPASSVNVAAAANGGVATASSYYSAEYAPQWAIDGNRRGDPWGAGGGWNDATATQWPDWLQVTFAGSQTIGEVDVFSVQDAYGAPSEPTASQTFTRFGLTDFQVQYWDGVQWLAVPGGAVTTNRLVYRKVTFPAVTTSAIRVYVTGAQAAFSRIAEVEAWTSPAGVVGNAPTVTMTAPTDTVAFSAPAVIRLAATAQPFNQTASAQIQGVAFYANQVLVGTATQTPYSVVWNDVPTGTYLVTPVARTAGGQTFLGPSLTVQVSDLSAAPLLQQSSLVYQGSFRVPSGTIGGSSFSYGGSALAYNPAHDSLFLVGYEPSAQVAEIAIPEARTSAVVSDLAVAGVLQVLTDPTEGKLKNIDGDTSNGVYVGGLLPYKDRLYLAAYSYYDANLSRQQTLSHFVSGLDFSVRGDVTGPFAVGTLKAGFVSGYFGLVPKAWQGLFGGPVLNGNCCLNIISRTSWGPAVFAIDPETIGAQTPAPATPLLYYTSSHPLGPFSGASASFNGTSRVKGVVFPEGSRSVLFFGEQGLGTYCYGTAGACGDPVNPYNGTHAYPYAYYVWAYDALDLADVKAGGKLPWTVSPYALWQLDLPYTATLPRILGAAYDPSTGRVFLAQALADNGVRPLIHVFTVQTK